VPYAWVAASDPYPAALHAYRAELNACDAELKAYKFFGGQYDGADYPLDGRGGPSLVRFDITDGAGARIA
jgi:hypothetical protein